MGSYATEAHPRTRAVPCMTTQRALRPCTHQRIAEDHAGDSELAELLKPLDEPFKKQVRDLRSSVVREACQTIEFLSQTLRSGFAPLSCQILSTMIESSASGNKVRCCCSVLSVCV